MLIFRSLLTLVLAFVLNLLAMGSVSAEETAVTPQHPLYKTHCMHCHEGGVPRAPHSITFSLIGPDAVYRALTEGPMRMQAASLSDEQKRELAQALGGAQLGADAAAEPNCSDERAGFDKTLQPAPSDWGMSPANWRYVSEQRAGITRENVASLTLKWAFGIPGVSQARSQPTIAGGSLFTGSQTGAVYALDFETGCIKWRFDAEVEVRNAPVVVPWTHDDQIVRMFFGDLAGNVYSVNAETGQLIWKQRAGTHANHIVTGTPRVFEDRLIVPLSSNEWASAADPAYPCCSSQGGVVALAIEDGRELWRRSVHDTAAQLTGVTNQAGAQLLAPAGAPVWGSPLIDTKRRRIYVGTGENYTSPATDRSDAVFALDVDTGEIVWTYQSTQNDAWNMACFIGGGANCPKENGPDFDIGAALILGADADGHEHVFVGQKSGHVFSLDPDTGALQWRHRLGRGSVNGGVHWGMAFDGTRLYVPMSDTIVYPDDSPGNPGLYALNPTDGKTLWFTPSQEFCTDASPPGCDKALSAPITATDDVVFAAGYDGRLRAYDTRSGALLWHTDTTGSYAGVNGITANGGSIEAAGVVMLDGHVIVNSGYAFGGRMPGNALLVFKVQ